MHPPRMSAPSCIVPPTEQLMIRPHIVPLLPTFHGMESENPYAHIKEFEEVCNTFQEGGASIDLMRLKLFPFTLKDKAKIWLNSLRPRSIRTWTDLQAEFLKKFFPTHRTNGLKRQISNFSAKENEKFYECWERYMEAINACPHHGFDTWLLVSYFYDGMSSSMKQLLETMCGGDFMSGMYTLNEDVDMKAKFAAMTRRLEELELKKMHEVQAVAETPVQIQQRVLFAQYQCSVWKHLQLKLEESSKFLMEAKSTSVPAAQPSQQASSLEQAIIISARVDFLLNHQNPKSIHEVETHEGESSQVRDVKALITLRSGKKVELPTPKPYVEEEEEEETKKREEIKGKKEDTSERKEDHDPILNANPRKCLLKKKWLNVNKKAFLTEQVSAIIQCKSPLKYKDPGCPTISVMIGGKVVEKALLDLGASVNLLPYSVYKQLGLGELKPTSINLSLADRSVKIPRGVIEDVLVQVDNFYYPVDFVVLDTDPIVKEAILFLSSLEGHSLLPQMQSSTVGMDLCNLLLAMTLELNIFYMSKKQITPEEEEGPEEVCIIDTLVEEHCWRRREEILPLFNKEEAQKADKEETPKLNLKPLPMELKYTYLEKNQQCPVVISSSLTSPQEKCLLEVLTRCKKAIGWQISDLKGISPLVCTHHIYMEEEAKPIRQPQRRLNPHLQEVVRVEVLKLLQAGIIYPISDSPWVSPTQVVPKKSGITVVQNEKGEEITTRLTSGWRVCIDYRRLNVVTRKDHFPLPFIDQVLERVSGHPFYCFLDGYSGYFQIEIDVEDQEKT
ncbi:Transposon Ty3-I Gag-Pol polyprotein, partial [Vitis vinifera]